MPDSSERFIAAAVAPLGDNAEMQVMAGQELEDLISRGKINAGCLAEAAETLEKGEPRAWPRWLLYGATALVSIMALLIAGRDYTRWRIATWTLFGMSDPINVSLPGPGFGDDGIGAGRRLPQIFAACSPR